MAQEFGTQLMVTQTERSSVANWSEVVILIKPAGVAEKQFALFGDEGIELELAHLQVQPRRIQQIVKANEVGEDVAFSVVVQSGLHTEGDVLVQSARGPDVDSRNIEAGSG